MPRSCSLRTAIPYSYVGSVPLRIAPRARFEAGIDFVAPSRVRARDVPRHPLVDRARERLRRLGDDRARSRSDRGSVRPAAAAFRQTARISATSTRSFSRQDAMRFLCWCSAALVLASCGGAKHSATHDPFADNAAAPLAVVRRGCVCVEPRGDDPRTISFAGDGGSRVEAYLVVPRSGGRHPGVLFLHGSGGNRRDLICRGGAARQAGSGDDDDLAAERRSDLSSARRQRAPRPRHARRSQRRRPEANRRRRLLARRADGGDPGRRRSPAEGGRDHRRSRHRRRALLDPAAVTPTSSSRPGREMPSCRTRSSWRSSGRHPGILAFAGTTTGHVVDGSIRRDLLSWQAAELGLR